MEINIHDQWYNKVYAFALHSLESIQVVLV